MFFISCHNKNFGSKSYLAQHINTHHTEKEFREKKQCPGCKKVRLITLCKRSLFTNLSDINFCSFFLDVGG